MCHSVMSSRTEKQGFVFKEWMLGGCKGPESALGAPYDLLDLDRGWGFGVSQTEIRFCHTPGDARYAAR